MIQNYLHLGRYSMNVDTAKYKWLKTWKHSEYLSPDYYHKLLRPYVFSGKDDLTLFRDYLSRLQYVPKNAIEFGCGTGRGTNVFLNRFKDSKLNILDLSTQMLNFTSQKFNVHNTICSDTIDFMKKTSEKFDFAFSLWSFSHSIHQQLEKFTDLDLGKQYIADVLIKFITENLSDNGHMFIIHFDSQSEEQTILMKQWAKKSKVYDRFEQKSLSLECIQSALESLKDNNIISYQLRHQKGEKIKYNNEDNALETFVNFHLEGVFNSEKDNVLSQIIQELRTEFKKYTNEKDQTISIGTGCYLIEISKNDTSRIKTKE